jgi:hypothetical protein
VEVEEKEPRDRSSETERHPRDEWLRDLWQQGEATEGQRGDRRDPCGKSVETVDEVQSDVHADDPEHRERHRERQRQLDETFG